jgi:hypothetical protein
MMIGANLLTVAITLLVCTLILLATKRFFGLKALCLAGLAIAGFLIYEIIDTTAICASGPIKWISPACSDEDRCGLGKHVFPCDGPFGAMMHSWTSLFGPMTVAIVLLLTFFIAQRGRKV